MKTRFKIYDLRFMIFLFVFFVLFLNLTSYFVNPVLAIDSSPSADIRSKLKALQEEIASRASQLKQEITQKLQNKAYTGILKSKTEESLILTTKNGDKNIKINEFTTYSSKKGLLNFKNLDIGDKLAALGDVDDADILTAKKIVEIISVQEESKQIFGQVTSLSNSNINITTKDGQNINLTVNSTTIYKTKNEDTSFSNIKTGKQIIVVAQELSNGKLTARFVYIIPQPTLLKPKTATNSATTSATKIR